MSAASKVEAGCEIDPKNCIGCGDNVVIFSVFVMTFEKQYTEMLISG